MCIECDIWEDVSVICERQAKLKIIMIKDDNSGICMTLITIIVIL